MEGTTTMKITLDRAQFLKALAHGSSVVEKRGTVPILSHVLLQAEGDKLTITSTDMDLALVESVPAVVETPGSLTVPAQMLCDIVRKLPDGAQIELSLNPNQQIHLKAGKARFNIPSLPSNQFPKLTQDDLPFQFKLPASTLKDMINGTKFAMSTEDSRYYLNGIYLHTREIDGKTVLRTVATDAHRLACLHTDLPEGAQDMPGVIIGRKALLEVHKLLDEQDTEILIKLSNRRIEFHFPTALFSCRLIDGSYPDYEQAIPPQHDRPIYLNAKEFSAAIDRVATVALDKDKVSGIKLVVNNNNLTLSAASQELGDAVEEIAVDYPFDHPIEVGFNARYLLDIAQQISEEEAQVYFDNGMVPGMIKGSQNQHSIFVVMPLLV